MKIFSCNPQLWTEHYDWLRRDVGLISVGLAKEGIESRLILQKTDGAPDDPRFLYASREEMESAAWWRSLGLHGLILEGAARPDFLTILIAARTAGISVATPLDSDGVIDPWIDPSLYFFAKHCHDISRNRMLPSVSAAAFTSAKLLASRLLKSRLLDRLSLVDHLMIESPLGCARLHRYFLERGHRELAQRLHLIPHPVPDDRVYTSTIPKESLIVSAARWNDAKKDGPTFARVLAKTLEVHSTYRAEVAGLGTELLEKLLDDEPDHVRNRITFLGRIPNEEMTKLCQKAQIFLITSRGEGFPNACSDAVCCGCSLAAPARLAAMHYFVSRSSGTLAHNRSVTALTHAMDAEILQWALGKRDPQQISEAFTADLHITNVARQVLAMFK